MSPDTAHRSPGEQNCPPETSGLRSSGALYRAPTWPTALDQNYFSPLPTELFEGHCRAQAPSCQSTDPTLSSFFPVPALSGSLPDLGVLSLFGEDSEQEPEKGRNEQESKVFKGK